MVFGVYGACQGHGRVCGERLSPFLLGLGLCVTIVLLSHAGRPEKAMASTVDPHTIIQRMGEAYQGIQDYTALLLKRERIDGKLLPLEKITLRFQEPFKVYMAWIEPYEGRTLVYVQGENDNKLRVTPGGLLKFMHLSLDPTGDLATRDAHHTILQAGIENMITHIMQEYRRGMARHEVQVRVRKQAKVDGRPAYHLEFIYPHDQSAGYYAYRGELWIDTEYYLPTKLRVYDWSNQLYEHYEYHQLRLNPGLDAKAFQLPPIMSGESSEAENHQLGSTP
jgi:outer membrane lipoprotein-sorting protein